MKNKEISINCPECGRFLIKANQKEDRVKEIGCRKCNKLIKYNPVSSFRDVRPWPRRTTSSGMTFI